MIRADYHLQYSITGMLGSFWSRAVTDKTKAEARTLATLSAHAPGLRQLEVPMRKLLSAGVAPVEGVRVPYLEGDFIYVGQDMVAAWRSELNLPDGTSFRVARRNLANTATFGQLLIGSDGRPLGKDLGTLLSLFESEDGMTGSDPLYIIPLPPGLNPIVIATRDPDRDLIQGIDFETGPGYLIMRESPGSTFFAGGFVVTHGTQKLRRPYDFTMQMNGDSFGHSFVAAFYRGSSSRTSFERAAAQAAGMFVLERDDSLISVQELNPTTARYVFLLTGVVDVEYPHTRLLPGYDYTKGLIVSNGFRIVGAGTPGWLGRAAGDLTLSLDGMLSVTGLSLPPGPMHAYYSEISESGKPHTRLQFAGMPANLNAFWSFQKNHELATGQFLSDTIGLSPTNPIVTVDFHAMLETFYGDRVLLVLPELEGAPDIYRRRLADFLQREKPMGSVLLVVAGSTDTDPPGDWMPEDTLSGLYEYLGFPSDDVVVYGAEGLTYDGYPLVYEGL